jgi:hypothetical protein
LNRPHQIHVNLPHPDRAHHHPEREHVACIPRQSFKLTAVKRYRMAKKPEVGEEKILLWRNILVAAAALLFLASLLPVHMLGSEQAVFLLRGAAYVLGAGAYLFEMLMMTDMFKRVHPFREMFMPYVFGALYIVLALAYFSEVFRKEM